MSNFQRNSLTFKPHYPERIVVYMIQKDQEEHSKQDLVQKPHATKQDI